MNEELIDKYLNQSLNKEEEQEFISLLKDEEFGRFLVRYCVEMHGYHSTAAKMLEDDLEQNKNQWVDLEKEKSGNWSLVALVAVAAVLAVAVFLFIPASGPELVSIESLSIERNGEKVLSKSFQKGDILEGNESKLLFDDKSSIILSGNMKLHKLAKSREVELLQGTAFFRVNKQKANPFVILSGKTRVEVIGTSFSVTKTAEEVRVSVEKGTVKFSNDKKSITLHQGEKAIERNGLLSAELKNGIIANSPESRDPDLVFEMTFDGEDPLDFYGLEGNAVLKKGDFVEGMQSNFKALKNGLIEISGSQSKNFRIPMTINAWVKVSQETFYGPIITKGDSSWRMQLSEPGTEYHGGYGLTEMDEYFNSKSKIKKDVWQMVTLVYSDKLALMYVDGKFEQRKETELMHLNNEEPIQIGGNSQMPDRVFEGLIDQVSIYKRALSEEEILLLYRRMIK